MEFPRKDHSALQPLLEDIQLHGMTLKIAFKSLSKGNSGISRQRFEEIMSVYGVGVSQEIRFQNFCRGWSLVHLNSQGEMDSFEFGRVMAATKKNQRRVLVNHTVAKTNSGMEFSKDYSALLPLLDDIKSHSLTFRSAFDSLASGDLGISRERFEKIMSAYRANMPKESCFQKFCEGWSLARLNSRGEIDRIEFVHMMESTEKCKMESVNANMLPNSTEPVGHVLGHRNMTLADTVKSPSRREVYSTLLPLLRDVQKHELSFQDAFHSLAKSRPGISASRFEEIMSTYSPAEPQKARVQKCSQAWSVVRPNAQNEIDVTEFRRLMIATEDCATQKHAFSPRAFPAHRQVDAVYQSVKSASVGYGARVAQAAHPSSSAIPYTGQLPRFNMYDVNSIQWVSPTRIRFCQDSIKGVFVDGRSISSTLDALKHGTVSVSEIPTINVFEDDGLLFSADNRRLYCFQEAGLSEIPVRFMPKSTVPAYKFTTKNQGRSVRLRHLARSSTCRF